MTGLTETYERQLWEELNALLAAAIPKGVSPEDAQRVVRLAIFGPDAEIRDLYDRVSMLARTEPGYLRDRMEEDNPVSTVRRRSSPSDEAGQQA